MFLPRLLGCCAVLALLLPHGQAAPPGSAQNWALAWSDEFDGATLDTTKWVNWLTGSRRQATNTPAAVTVGGGNLTISTYTSGGTHYTGMVATDSHYLPAYGYIEARIDYNDSPGMWSAFWLQSPTIGNPIGSPHVAGTEIDIAEHRSVDGNSNNISDHVVGNIHWDGYGADHKSVGYDSGARGLASGFHVYGIEWTPLLHRYYIDGTLVWTVDDSTNSPVSERSEFIVLSSEVDDSSTTWAGSIPSGGYGSQAATTTKMVVDYVRVYARTESIVNGDFEAQVAPWYQVNQASLTAGQGHNGTQGVRVNPNTAAGSFLGQDVYGLLPNTKYILTGWANAAATTWAPIRIGVENYGGAQTYQAIGSSGYTQATVPFTTGASNSTASVFAWQPTQWGDAYVDDFLLRRAAAVNNRDLEDGDSAFWTTYGGTTAAADGTAHSGSFALRYPSGTVPAGSDQEIVGLSPNTTYVLSGWTINGGQGLSIGVKYFGGNETSKNVVANAWTRGTVSFTTGATNTSATIYGYRPASTAASYTDDFFVYEPLAAPWTDADVTAIPLVGVAGRRGSKFVMQTAGTDIWNASDRFHFVSQQVTGDCQITARVCSLENTGVNAKGGVMMRESLTSSARQVTCDWTPGQAIEFIRRTTAGANAASDVAGNITDPPWVRLKRRGNVFTAYYSTDGASWVQTGLPQTIAMPTTFLAGLAGCSCNDTAYTEAVLDNVTVAGFPPDVTVSRPAADAVTIYGAPANLRLTAAGTDDGLHGALSIAWSEVSGPATATFANAAVLDTTVALPAIGRYVLRVSIGNSVGTSTHDVVVTVSAASDSSLVLWLKLNEASGTIALDSSGNGNQGAVLGGGAWQPNGGVLNGAFAGNASDGSISVPDAPTLDPTNAFTLSYWFKTNSLTYQGLVTKRDGPSTNNAFTTYLAPDGLIYVDIDSANDRFASKTVFALNTWYHVLLTYDGTLPVAKRAALYVNGVLDQTAAETSATIPNSPSPVRVGLTHIGSSPLDGLMDDVRLYRRALSATEAAGLANPKVAPTISCGAPPAATKGQPASLAGSAVSEVSGAMTLTWSKVSGPGTATFANSALAATTVTFNQIGTYVLRLTAASPASEVFSQITITASGDPNVFSEWAGNLWPGVSDPNIVVPNADPDGDGLTNLVEWALGLDPKKAQHGVWTPGQPGLPVQGWISVGSSTFLSMQVRRPIGRTGVTYGAIVSGDLSSWGAGVQEGTPTDNGDGTETVVFRDTVPAASTPPGTSRFIRLKVTQP